MVRISYKENKIISITEYQFIAVGNHKKGLFSTEDVEVDICGGFNSDIFFYSGGNHV